jgi:hypothetical protein
VHVFGLQAPGAAVVKLTERQLHTTQLTEVLLLLLLLQGQP